MSKASFVARWRLAFTDPQYGLDKLTRLVLWTISLFMAPDGSRGFPSIETISRRSGMCTRAVKHHLKIAQRGGWVQKEFAGFTGKGWKHHIYIPLIPGRAAEYAQDAPPSEEKLIKGGAPDAPRYAEGGARRSTLVVHGMHTNNTNNNSVKNNNSEGGENAPSRPPDSASVHDIKKNRSKHRKRATILPADFSLSPAMRDFAASKDFSGDVESLFESFCDYWRGNGKKWVDWFAVWRNWVRKEIKFEKEKKQNGKPHFNRKHGRELSEGDRKSLQEKYAGFSREPGA